jgi:NTP pyrophosphatase (non-canonical NTP hydrolase)
MDKSSYREIVKNTSKKANFDSESALLLIALGLVVESGEFADFLKKSMFHNQDLDRENMIKKIGDLRWFIELAAINLGVTIQEVEEINISKLRTRYPEAFK